MKRIAFVASVGLIALATAAGPISAEPQTLVIDKPHSEVSFNIRHFFSKTPGWFTDFGGTIVYDSEKLQNSSVNVTIQSASINTNHEKRDGHLKSADFFEVEKYPTITFKSTKVTPGGEKDRFKVQGDLTIRGVTKPVVLDAQFLGMGNIGIGGNALGTKAGFEATTTVNRKDFGIVWNKALDQGGAMLGDDVFITLSVEANQPRAQAEAQKPASSPPDKK